MSGERGGKGINVGSTTELELTLNRYHTAYTEHTNTMSGTSNLKERFTQLQGAKERSEPDHACPRIQRVAHHLRDRKDFTKHYTPKLVSMGPIHHGEPKLRLGEHYKQMWASTYIHTKKITFETLHENVAGKIKYLKGLFGDDLFSFFHYLNEGFASTDEMISWTLFVDGCALLQILEHAKLEEPEKMNVKVDQLVLVMQDVLLMENQLPYPLLKLLWGDQEEGKLIEIMIDYLECHHWATLKDHIKLKDKLKDQPKPFHLLDLQRNIILHDAREGNPTPNNQTNGKPNVMVKYRYIPRTHACV
ncbi:hypothetical protein Fmac_001024 [Flemingia macrophylla]|uniref:Uncharacterized protein n=1 Tax=Flemingia macrophylla TaxID=520843 RepID=A0ABD1NFY9_9FABA